MNNHFNYFNIFHDTGPDHWSSSAPDCGATVQSPVDIESNAAYPDPALSALDFLGYDQVLSGAEFINNGHTGNLFRFYYFGLPCSWKWHIEKRAGAITCCFSFLERKVVFAVFQPFLVWPLSDLSVFKHVLYMWLRLSSVIRIKTLCLLGVVGTCKPTITRPHFEIYT